MALSASSGTPPGTLPQPTRRSTKRKRVGYGAILMQKHQERQARKKARREQASPVKALFDAKKAAKEKTK